MNLGALTKEFAKQAIGDRVKEVVDSVSEPSRAAAVSPEATVGSLILGQLQAMQNALKDDQELAVMCNTGVEVLRIREVFLPSWKLAVLIGTDASDVVTRVILPVDSLSLTCKLTPVAPGAKAVRLRLMAPKP